MISSPALMLYRGASAVAGAFAGIWLNGRAREGKEDPARLGERFGRYTRERPEGPLIWLHAASVGESGVALALIAALAARDASYSFLLSTGTRTSADIIARRAPARTTHVYAPLDRGDVVQRFLTHWRPDLGVFVESELWPNLILAAEARGVPLALVNARMSPKSLGRWQRWPAAAGRLLRAFAFVSAADQRTADALAPLSDTPVVFVGNLKLAAPAPPVDAAASAALKAEIGDRKVWVAASTHDGEELFAETAHGLLREQIPNALLIIVPRHPERGDEIVEEVPAPRRSLWEPIGPADIYIADTLGELGLFYAVADVAFIGGSLFAHLKGHNAIEPAKLGVPIITGPYVESFQDLYDGLFAADGAACADTFQGLAREVAKLMNDPELSKKRTEAALAVVHRNDAALDVTVSRLLALLSHEHVEPRPASASA